MPSSGSDLELRAHKVCAPANKALQAIQAHIEANNIDIFYALKMRAKTVLSSINKVLQKRSEGKPDYEPETMTDIAGVRAVTLFREDVIEALRIFLQMINHEGAFSGGSPFVRSNLREAIIYTSAAESDPEAINSRLRSVFSTFGHPISDEQVKHEKTGYSSIHLVAEVAVNFEGASKIIPVEIQIRTVFEDAWGEIDHKLRYSLNRARNKSTTVEDWQPHLNVLKTFVDGCGQYAGVIKNQAIDPSLRPQFAMAPLLPVDNAEQAIANLGSISNELKKAWQDAYDARREALKVDEKGNPEEIKIAFIEAASKFRQVAEMLSAEVFENTGKADYAAFLVEMEVAFCLLSTEDKAAIGDAIQIYSRMQERSPGSVIVHYRSAQALFKLGEFEAAEKLYGRADELLSSDQHVPETHWLRSTVPQQWGYCIWTRSLGLSSDNSTLSERLTLLRRAYALALMMMERAPEGSMSKTRSANNALYYAVEFCTYWKDGCDVEPIASDEIRAHIERLEGAIELATVPLSRISWLDTLCRAYIEVKEPAKAVSVAERIEHLLVEKAQQKSPENLTIMSLFAIIGNLNARERDILEYALLVLRAHGPGPEKSSGTNGL